MKPNSLEPLHWIAELMMMMKIFMTRIIKIMKPGGLEPHWSGELDQGDTGWSPRRRPAPGQNDQNYDNFERVILMIKVRMSRIMIILGR